MLSQSSKLGQIPRSSPKTGIPCRGEEEGGQTTSVSMSSSSTRARECSSLRRPRVVVPTRSLRVPSRSATAVSDSATLPINLPSLFTTAAHSTDISQVSDPAPPSPPHQSRDEENTPSNTLLRLLRDSKNFEKMQNDIEQLSIRLNELQAQLRLVTSTTGGGDSTLTRSAPLLGKHDSQSSADVFPPPPLQLSRILLGTASTDESPTPPPPPRTHHLLPFSPPALPPRTYRKKRECPPPPKPQRTFLESSPSLSGSLTLTRLSNLHREDSKTKWSEIVNVNVHSEDFNARTLSEDIKSSFQRDICWFEMERLFLFVNPFNDLSSHRRRSYAAIGRMATHALSHHEHSVFFFGDSGSGKSYLAEQLVLAVHARAHSKLLGSPLLPRSAKPAATHLTLLPSLFFALNAFTAVTTPENNRASRVVHWYEILVRDAQNVRTRMHHFFTDATNLSTGGANVFSMCASQLSDEEKEKYFLRSWKPEGETNATVDGRMSDLRVALTALCFHWDDVMRVVGACHLLQGLRFKENDDQVDVYPQRDLENIACLLGVSPLSLYKVLTKRLVSVKSERASTGRSEVAAAFERTKLVTALYTRMVAAMLRRMNAILDLMADEPPVSRLSDESAATPDPAVLTAAGTERFSSAISVFDCHGMGRPARNGFEELCINVIVEKNFQFFLTNMSAPDEEVLLDVVPCVESAILDDFLMPEFGIFYVLDDECESETGSTRRFLHAVHGNRRHMKKVTVERGDSLVVKHFEDARTIAYDCTKIVEKNRNALRQEAVEMFADEACCFAFGVSLFRFDLEAWKEGRGASARVVVDTGAAPVGDATLTEQLIARFDSLAIRGSRSHLQLVHCSKSNANLEYARFDAQHVKEQLHAWTIPRLALGHSSTRPGSLRSGSRTTTRAASLPEIPPRLPLERNYTIKNGRKMAFPQRRTVISSHQDVSSGVSLRAGQVLRATGFADAGRALLIETSRGLPAQIPIHLTKLSSPPTFMV